jgi:hypothetical protein
VALGGAAAGAALGLLLTGGLALPALIGLGAATAASRWLGGHARAVAAALEAFDAAVAEARPALVEAIGARAPTADGLLGALSATLDAEAEAEALQRGEALRALRRAQARLGHRIGALQRHAAGLDRRAAALDAGLRAAAARPGVIALAAPAAPARVDGTEGLEEG